ncbi:MAG: glycerol-3-phosphate 1-O-acyltransferase PlsY [Clostridia bacterium]|nr:glycerol-3-phosphate 1-O-acyltransferase PlsY [Clostridia bacterium]
MFNTSVIYLCIMLLIIGYLCGNLHGAFIIGKLFKKQDIRDFGSGNSGSTNALRVFGFRLALPAFIIDFVKGFLPVFFVCAISDLLLKLIGCSMIYTGETIAMLKTMIAFGIILGHNYPFVLKFKGGKGIASSVGILMGINWLVGFIFGSLILIISFTTKYVSLGSCISSLLLPFIMYFITWDKNYIILSVFLAVFALYRHKSNIVRLKNGTENKFGKKK